ncbi:hypothetical protein ACF08N_35735 [Streptomyces sp. NPDC015127]|uniref:hypothetical protein n=1 Tax=Streptomyces sp. NPDC015127 TaxID=3364939 RepID=UPI0037020601
MPKKQSPPLARRARRRQRETGEKYTDALRNVDSPGYVLAQALRAAGLIVEAADLTALLAEWAVTAPLQRAFEAADAARYYSPDDVSDAEYEKLELAGREAWTAVEQSWGDDKPFSDSRRELVAVFPHWPTPVAMATGMGSRKPPWAPSRLTANARTDGRDSSPS